MNNYRRWEPFLELLVSLGRVINNGPRASGDGVAQIGLCFVFLGGRAAWLPLAVAARRGGGGGGARGGAWRPPAKLQPVVVFGRSTRCVSKLDPALCVMLTARCRPGDGPVPIPGGRASSVAAAVSCLPPGVGWDRLQGRV